MLSKPKRFQCELYLEFIRKQKCCCCGKRPRGDPHHCDSKGSGGSDLSSVPLCRKCHGECHALGVLTFQVRKLIDFVTIRESLLRKAIEKGIFNNQ